MFYKILQYFEHINLIRNNKYNKLFTETINCVENIKYEKNDYILTQIVYDYNYIFKLTTFCQSYAILKNYNIIAYDTYFSWNNIRNIVDKSINKFLSNGFQNIYSSFTKVFVRNINSSRFSDYNKINKQYKEILSHLNDPKDILNIKFDEMLVGDLIYDTYLRFYKKPTITSINNDLKKVIKISLNIYYNFNKVFYKYDVKVFVTSLTSYVNHGIPTRMCIIRNIPVYAISSNNYIIHKVEKSFPYHSINYTKFTSDKLIKSNYDIKNIFESRFKGEIDNAISYMRKSSYSKEDNTYLLKDIFSKCERNVVIYIHDFYDSPHINRNLYFNDLFHFLDSVLNNLVRNNTTNYFIKPHPNSVYDSNDILINLVKKHNNPHIFLLDGTVSNNDIIKMKPDLIATARGTISIEMAYMSIPVVALYDNPYINFHFVHTCYSTNEYYDIINGIKNPIINYDKNQILSFYYQYFLEQTISDKHNVFSNLFDINLFNKKNMNQELNSSFKDFKFIFANSKYFINQYIIKNNL